jgi:hypothetical protein
MAGKAAGSPAYWRYVVDRERSWGPAGPGKRKETLDTGHQVSPRSARGFCLVASAASCRRRPKWQERGLYLSDDALLPLRLLTRCWSGSYLTQ